MFNRYPYTDFHELNLDWIIAEIKKLHAGFDDFKAANAITNAGAWDITKQYQAWTVVSDNNVGYISVRPVPAGIAVTNTDYWALIADYDILITDLSNRISVLENAVADINNVKLPTITADDMIFIGDSYAVDASAGGKSWLSYVLDVYPDAMYSAVGGTGFSSDLYISNNFLQMLQNISVAEPDHVKKIFIFAGANDANLVYDGTSSEAIVEDRINAFCAYCRTAFKNATVYIGFVAWYKQYVKDDAYIKTRNVYRNTAINNPNAAYIEGLEPIMKNGNYINGGDLVHPVAASSEVLGRYILEAVGTCAAVHYNNILQASFTKDAGISNVIGINAASTIVEYDGDRCRLNFFGTANANTNIDVRIAAATISTNDDIAIGTFTNLPWISYNAPSVEAICTFVDPDSSPATLTDAICKMFIYNNTLYLKVMSTGLTMTNIKQILLPSPVDITLFMTKLV